MWLPFGTWSASSSFSFGGVFGCIAGIAVLFPPFSFGAAGALIVALAIGVLLGSVVHVANHFAGATNTALISAGAGKIITGAAIAGYAALSAIAITDVTISKAPDAYNEGYESGMSEIRRITNAENMQQSDNEQVITPTKKPSKTPTSRPKPAKTKTPQPSYPTLYADRNYQCRESPWKSANHVLDISAGTTHRIIGRASNGWYAIAISSSLTSHTYCWIGGGTVSGDLSTVKYYEVEPPTTSSESGQVTVVDGTSSWNNNACYNNYDPNTCYAVYSLTPIGSLTCDELKSYGWDESFRVDGKTLWKLHALNLFGSSEPAFYNSEARRACPSLFP